jgi:hypothetical protein
MANTYTLIASSTVGSGGAADIEFTSIPSTYTDLSLVLSTRSSRNTATGTSIYIAFNNNNSAIYTYRNLYGQGTGAYSETQASGTNLNTRGKAGFTSQDNNTASTFGSASIYIPNYAGSAYKSYSSDFAQENNSATDNLLGIVAGLFSDTTAISSIKITAYQGADFNLQQYSTAYLYGISNA